MTLWKKNGGPRRGGPLTIDLGFHITRYRSFDDCNKLVMMPHRFWFWIWRERVLPKRHQWRRTLPLTTRLKLNHPNAVWRKFLAAYEPEKSKGDKPTLRDSLASLSEEVAAKDREIADLREHVAELAAAREAADAAAFESRHEIAQASTIWCRIRPQLKPIAIRARDAAGGKWRLWRLLSVSRLPRRPRR
jgi:hypothetical protein